MMCTSLISTFAVVAFTVACQSTTPRPTPVKKQVPRNQPPDPNPKKSAESAPTQLEPIGLRVADGKVQSFDAGVLLTEGNNAFGEGNYADALAHYNELVRTFPSSRYVTRAHFNRGLTFEAQDDYVNAANAYESAYLAAKDRPDGRDALLRKAAVLAETGDLIGAESALQILLTRGDIGRQHRLEILSRLGYVQLQAKKYDAAEKQLRAAVDIYRRMATMQDPYYPAMAHYYYANVPHRRALALPMRPESIHADIRAKTKLADSAYVRYQRSLTFLSAYWSTASAYQMSQLYYDIWREATSAPLPVGVPQSEAAYFRNKVMAEVRPLLEKALQGHRQNLGLAAAYRTHTPWSRGSEARVKEISAILVATPLATNP